MSRCEIVLKKHEEKRLLEGHTWVYSNEVQDISGDIKSGDIAYVFDHKKQFIGKGFLNTSSKIFVRLLTQDEHLEIDDTFFYDRLKTLKTYKEDLGYDNSYRLCFGEADHLPGLIIDKFDAYVSIQVLSLGMDMRKQAIVDALVSLFQPKGIYERSDVKVREKEGLSLSRGLLYGDVPDHILIKQNMLTFEIDIKQGQKTGYYLDQQDNHVHIKPYVLNKRVLDCFSNQGGFGLHAAYFGAQDVTCLDSSGIAVKHILRNAALNDLKQVKALEVDVFSQLRDYARDGQTFDTIILDPPAFAKKQEHVKKAYAAYKDINYYAMQLISQGGYLYTCSCSHFMPLTLFLEMIKEAAFDAKKRVSVVETRSQSKDHAALIGSDESSYLKCVVLRVTEI